MKTSQGMRVGGSGWDCERVWYIITTCADGVQSLALFSQKGMAPGLTSDEHQY